MDALKQSNDGYAAVTGAYYAVKDGETIGCVVSITGSGYGGVIELTVGIDAQGRIAGLEVGDNNETPGLAQRPPAKLSAASSREKPPR
jgi:electron transport complex protein RnfG